MYKNIISQMKSKGINKCTIGFSTGKDSIVGLDILLKSGIKVMPFYFYICPELDFIEKNIELYESHFNIKVIRLPHPAIYNHLSHNDWQPFQQSLNISQTNWPNRSFIEFTRKYLESLNLEYEYIYDVNCMKMSDSLNRRLLLRNSEDINEKTKVIYLTKYFTDKNIYSYISENNIPMTKDYEIFGRSWDGLSYHFLSGIKEFYPNDYDKIKSLFPLIDAELFKYKLYKKHSK